MTERHNHFKLQHNAFKRIIQILKRGKPDTEIVGGPELFIDRGSTINLTCVVRHSPEPPAYIFWNHNDAPQSKEGRSDVGKNVINREYGEWVKHMHYRRRVTAQLGRKTQPIPVVPIIAIFHRACKKFYRNLFKSSADPVEHFTDPVEFLQALIVCFKIISYSSSRGGVSVATERGETSRSILLIQKARPSDSGNYQCNPSNARPANVTVHVLNGEHPEAMQHGGNQRMGPSLGSLAFISYVLLAYC
ncbi:hypothetical protein NQ317_007065 [Molorchus minor]|uniref:Ig-like domain-containing protein n=1 Tax=Molorchus minor TaxID=1323400 RepID=A0ABQ9K3U9_9CUCU|nr:hypothetical protein NQ317_007065 [Molorchus minor]